MALPGGQRSACRQRREQEDSKPPRHGRPPSDDGDGLGESRPALCFGLVKLGHLAAVGFARLAALGLDVAITTRAPDFAPRVLEATGGHGADLVVNAVGGTVFAECVRAMAFEARLATVGYVDHTLKAEIDLQALHMKRLTLFGVSNKMRSADQKAAGVPAFKTHLLPAIADGRIQPLVDRVFPFDQLTAAQAHMEANQHLGKIVLKISD